MRFSCALTFCCKTELGGLFDEAGAVRPSGGEQGGVAAHPQLSTIQSHITEPYFKHDLRIACPSSTPWYRRIARATIQCRNLKLFVVCCSKKMGT